LEIVAFDTTADWGLRLIIAARACFFPPFLFHVFSALFSLSFFALFSVVHKRWKIGGSEGHTFVRWDRSNREEKRAAAKHANEKVGERVSESL